MSNAVLNKIKGINDLDKLTDIVCNFVNFSTPKKLKLVVEPNRINRAKRLITELNIELAILNLENKIENDLKADLDEMQKDAFKRKNQNN